MGRKKNLHWPRKTSFILPIPEQIHFQTCLYLPCSLSVRLINARSASIDLLRAKVPIAPMVIIDEPKTGTGKESLIKSLAFSLLNFDPDKPFIFTSAAFWMFFLFVLAGYSLVYKKWLSGMYTYFSESLLLL